MTSQGSQVHPRKALLLTGAGFSRPFGGYLASEMWALIFRQPEVSGSERLRTEMLREMNFERVYEQTTNSTTYSNEEKRGLTEAVWRAYFQMHSEMCVHKNAMAAYEVVRAFVSRFNNPDLPGERGFVFTLNQNLLVEKFHTSDTSIVLPGVISHDADGQNVTLPEAADVERAAEQFWQEKGQALVYVKLHGSFNWRRNDGSRSLVIGTKKGTVLSGEPLLKWYQDIFHRVLHEPGRSLLVIGYSFRDPHINETILSAVNTSGLRLFVMSPRTPDEFRNMLLGVEPGKIRMQGQGDDIWKSLYGYYCGSVEHFYTAYERRLPPQGQSLFENLGLDAGR